MNDPEAADLTTKVLAVLGSVALGFCALINAIIAAIVLFTGQNPLDSNMTTDAHHAALVAKLIAIGFAVLAAIEFGAGEFLRRRLRNIVVPIACATTIAGEAAFSVWSHRFHAFDALIVGCALFAYWTWWRLPRREVAPTLAAV
jgi:hypothetical protein